MLADFHCHTTFSDGKFTPKEVVHMAVEAQINCLAITDHDAVSGCQEAIDTVGKEKLPLKIIKGIEFSIDSKSNDVHLLGLDIDDKNKKLNQQLKLFRDDREKRIHRTLEVLSKLGYPLTIEDILAQANEKIESLGRPHVAAALVAKGYFANQQVVFDQMLHSNGPAYVTHLRPTLGEAIDLIHEAGGLAIIAHPHTIKDQGVLLEAVKLGLDGLEAYYPKHTPEQLQNYLAFAKEHNLKISGGSDFHGIEGKYPSKLGLFLVPIQLLNLW